jgi:uracil-DNA glycosylase
MGEREADRRAGRSTPTRTQLEDWVRSSQSSSSQSSVQTDEIYEKYLQKAIAEINELGDEIARAAEERVPVLGSGHPLADVMLLKYEPQRAEVQEGVAFFGRAGQAILKSLQRLRIDPMAIYGTNCLKFAGGDEDEARPWLARELHIVQPKLVVVMGERALSFLNDLEFPLSQPVEERTGDLQQLTPTIEALYAPDIDESLDEQSEKTRFWNAFKLIGPWWEKLPPY